MWIKIAIRNIFRNVKRTALCVLLIGVGLGAIMLTDALILGMEENMIKTATSTFLGDGQIHQKDFRDAFLVEKTINNRKAIIDILNSHKDVKSYAERVISFSMISSPKDVQAVNLYGIDFLKDLPKLREIVGGKIEEKAIFLGSRLTELLDVSIGEKVVITVAEAYTGNLIQELFRIKGIFKFNSKEMDERMAFISINEARKMLGIGNETHEIVIKMRNPDLVFTSNLWKELSQDDNEALGWNLLMPELEKILKLSKFSVWIMAFMLFLVIIFGIINTIFASIYERSFEFGVLKSIGTRNSQLFKLIILESLGIALFSVVIGTLIAIVSISILGYTGISYSGLNLAGVTFQEPIYTRFRLLQFILYPAFIIIMTLIPSFYPAIYLVRTKPLTLIRSK